MTRRSGPKAAPAVAAKRLTSNGTTTVSQLRGRARRLRGRADAIWWGEFQAAHSRGDHDRAEVLERFARRLEERADLRDAQAWQPRVLVARLDDDESRQLARIFDELLAARERERLAAMARRAEAERFGFGARYFEVALEREAERTRCAAVGNRSNTLASAAYSLGRFVCEGQLTEGDVLGALVPASSLPSREAHSVVRGVLRRRCRGEAA